MTNLWSLFFLFNTDVPLSGAHAYVTSVRAYDLHVSVSLPPPMPPLSTLFFLLSLI